MSGEPQLDVTVNGGLCPCGSMIGYGDCCFRFIGGSRGAGTAEELMRTRFTANVIKDIDYLMKTWHPDNKPVALNPEAIPDWKRLRILRTESGNLGDETGVVEFRAIAVTAGELHVLHELSRFVFMGGFWYYTDGDIIEANSARVRAGRNDPCPCQSGKKFKKCCWSLVAGV